jgi:xylan 1,4-beta-xylosidase
LTFAPGSHQQIAGITHYYNRSKFHSLGLTWHEAFGRVLSIMSSEADSPDGRLRFALDAPQPLPANGPVRLAMRVAHERLQFQWSLPGDGWRDVGPVLDASLISDEAGPGAHGSFTGAFAGMFACDMAGTALPADFAQFSYRPGPRA